jgi:PAS domain S-box-containing protein
MPGEDDKSLEILWQDGERVLCKISRDGTNGDRYGFMPARYVGEHPAPDAIKRLEHEYELKEYLERDWAVRPLELTRDHRRTLLAVDFQGGERLDKLIGSSNEVGKFLRWAIALSTAIGRLHARGLVHKDIKPTNIVVDEASNRIWLTGFGIASRLPREHQPPSPPEFIAGTLPYVAPEQTGRMNRSIDSRSDLYSLGVTLYEMFVGTLPFTASDPMEWVHCHIARVPVAPSRRRSEIPDQLSAIILKLLAKAPEDRYQTAAGVEADLRRCLSALETSGRVESFPLGAGDVPDRLLVPEKLYGREKEIELLLGAFDRVVSQGTTELVLVSGYSGVGKSSVVNELHRVLVPPRGIFAAGKFDQYKRDIPYATLAQAFQSLVRQILGKSDAEVARWRDSLGEALGPNAQLLVNLIPEIELIIGTPPPVPDLPPQEAKNRFQRVLRRFIGVFARPEHPLALFLDDLQWLDTATLELIKHLVADSELRHVLLVGAYRDNEVDPGHPLMRTLQEIRAAGTRFNDIVLSPLELEDLTALVADALHCHADHSRPLAQLIQAKTGGNPFFAIQFLTELAEEELLAFDPAVPAWHWDIDSIRAKNYAGNVVDLMAGKLRRLSAPAQEALKQFACLGNAAETSTLVLTLGETEESMHTAFAEAEHAGLVVHHEHGYKFLHDRIQQAAYSLVPDEHRADVHLRIGRVLLANMTEDQLAEHLFDVASQLNRGAVLLVDHDEKANIAAIDLKAGRKAKASVAFASARAYFSAGMALLDENDWSSQYELTFNLWIERAECEFLTGALDTAGQLIEQLLPRVASKVDEAAVYHLKVRHHILKSEPYDAISTALTCLRRLGIDMPARPTQEQVQAEYETIWQILDGRSIESLVDLPLMTDPTQLATMRVLSEVASPAYFIDSRLFCLVICRMVKVNLQHGLSAGPSAYGYVTWGFLLGGAFHRYRDGYRFAKLACDLVEKHGLMANRAKVYVASGVVAPWTQPIVDAIDFVRKGIRTAIEMGEALNACHAMFVHVSFLLARNDPLDAVWRESETSLDFVRRAKYDDIADILVIQQRFIATMQGRTATLSTFSDVQFDEAAFEAQITEGRRPMTISWHWIVKLKARFLSGNYAEALAAADNTMPVLAVSSGQIQQLDYFYYTALTVSALYEAAGIDQQQAWRELLAAHREQLREWAENYPPTFEDKHALVSAEIARLEGRDADAMRLYEQAIRSAHEHGFVQNEGVAHEVAARFYAAHGSETSADAHLRNARHCYLRWGADGKVQQLDRLYPHLAATNEQLSAGITGSPVQHLDVASVVKASQTLSSEIVLPKLVERLMKIAIENAGASHGLLILPSDKKYLIQAEARANGDAIEVTMRQEPIARTNCPESLVRYVIRTRESVILDDTSKSSQFSGDDYLRDRKPKSILCLPLIKQRELTGVLLLENTLTSHAFTPARIAVLELLAAQAAISLENTRLYNDLQERESKIRRLVEANIIGICIFDLEGRLIEANDTFLNIVGYSRDDLISDRLRWPALVPPEWAGVAERAMVEIATTGTFRPREFEYSRKDHSRVPVFVGAATFGELRHQGVAFVVDLTERKRSEEALRRAQADLAHVSRITTLGEMTASIAHEVNQPLGSVVNNANACLTILPGGFPRAEEVRQALEEIVEGADRASAVISRIRNLSKKVPYESALVDLNHVVTEVMSLVKHEAATRQVNIQITTASDLPTVRGDRVQLQQVLLNLVANGMEAMTTIEPSKRIMTISARSVMRDEKPNVLVSVQDAGTGFKPEEQGRLFDAFYSTKPDGMGMGLGISRSIIEAHGGRLWAEVNHGTGATFLFSLPIAGHNGL